MASVRSDLSSLPLTRAGALLPFIAFLRTLGAPVDRWLAANRLAGYALDQPDALIPLLNACRFLENAAHTEGLPHLGLLVGQRTPVEQLARIIHKEGRSSFKSLI